MKTASPNNHHTRELLRLTTIAVKLGGVSQRLWREYLRAEKSIRKARRLTLCLDDGTDGSGFHGWWTHDASTSADVWVEDMCTELGLEYPAETPESSLVSRWKLAYLIASTFYSGEVTLILG